MGFQIWKVKVACGWHLKPITGQYIQCDPVLLLLLFLWEMVEKLSHHHSGLPVEFDGVLEHLLVGIEFRAM